MYTNINTSHALTTLHKWLTLHHDDLPHDYPTQMVLEATKLVMTNNVFQFDDTYWLQLTGTAMGSNLAVAYAQPPALVHLHCILTQSLGTPPMTLVSPPVSPLLMKARAERCRHIAHNL